MSDMILRFMERTGWTERCRLRSLRRIENHSFSNGLLSAGKREAHPDRQLSRDFPMVSADGNWRAGQGSRLSVWVPKIIVTAEGVGGETRDAWTVSWLSGGQEIVGACDNLRHWDRIFLGSASLTRRTIWGVGFFYGAV